MSHKPKAARNTTGRLVASVFLGIIGLGFAAVIFGFLISGEERNYTGSAEVLDSNHRKSLCSVEVEFPNGKTHSYSFRAKSDECSTFEPGMTVQIDDGKVVREDR